MLLILLFAISANGQPVTDLWLRGYSVIPSPRHVRLSGGDIRLGAFMIEGDDVRARAALLSGMNVLHGLAPSNAGTRINLAVRPGAVKTNAAPELDRQAYRLEIVQSGIEITGNAPQGLYYGAQTLVQLLRDGRLPIGVIEDWPTMELRFLHWDTKHHQDRMETLKRYLDWAALMKVNAIGFELDDKFSYPNLPDVGAPGAFTPAEMQEIVNYGLERYIQVVPVIQAPAHMAYVLKHPRYAHLKADGNNYQSAMCDPRTYELLFKMYDDVIQATRGVQYFFVSTDEVYYAGIESSCAKPYNETNRSLQWIDFAVKAHEHLKSRGRRMLAWVEHPVLPEHIKLLPPDLIDGVGGEDEYFETENKLGMRQLAYVSLQGGEWLFPNIERLRSAMDSIARGKAWRGKPIGAFGAAWGDSGLHNETFWLGWSTVAQYSWTPEAPAVEQHAAEFFRLYYGPRVTGMFDLYREMQSQARAWQSSWERVKSKTRASGYGNSYGKGRGTDRWDYTQAAPALPNPSTLAVASSKYGKRAEAARAEAVRNERLIHALLDNIGRASRNQYNLEVFLSLARFIGHHWNLIDALASAERSLESSAKATRPAEAVGHMVAAYRAVDRRHREGLQRFEELTKVFEKSRYPKGREVNGRKFVHVLDDTKDHWADRTPDLGYMYAQEKSMELDKWLHQLRGTLEAYAKRHNVPVRGLGEARLEE